MAACETVESLEVTVQSEMLRLREREIYITLECGREYFIAVISTMKLRCLIRVRHENPITAMQVAEKEYNEKLADPQWHHKP